MTDDPGSGPAAGNGLVRVRLDLAYDGTRFAGWARQPGLRTVQGCLEAALDTVLRREPLRLTCAGRTDAGVHARGQVAHFDVSTEALQAARLHLDGNWSGSLLSRLNGLLDDDVRVRGAVLAPAGFDARFSALWRRYAYRVCDDARELDPLRRSHVLWRLRPLDLAAMNEATTGLLGEHDFVAFCRQRSGATTVRALHTLEWVRDDRDGLAVLTVCADAFCHHMVRALTGALLLVGDGRRGPAWPAAVLAAGRRDPEVPVAPPRGLTLEEVSYPDDHLLLQRAERTRAKRVLADPADAGRP